MPYRPTEFFDLSHAPPVADIPQGEPAWEAIRLIAPTLESLDWQKISASAGHEGISTHAFIGERVHLGAGTTVEAGATIKGPAWFGENCHVRAGAYVRENVIVGNNVTLGNSCEFKNCVLFDDAEIPHFNYVGDSILGFKAHLGAGAILSNVRLDHKTVHVPDSPGSKKMIDTGLRKFSAIVGDRVEIGCNSVISPGSILGPDSVIYPGTHWRGVLPSATIVKIVQEQILKDTNPANG